MQWLREMWTKEGPGIPKDAPKKTGLALFGQIFAREWWEIVKLNILFILAALLIVPIPAAVAATAFVSVAFVEDRNTYLLRDFIEALRRFFWRATMWGLALVAVIGLSGYATVSYAAAARDNLFLALPFTIALVVTLFVVVLASHVMVMMVMMDLPAGRLLRLATLASVARPLPVLGALAFVAGLCILMPATLNFSLGILAIVFAAHRAAVMVLARPFAPQADLQREARGAKLT
jgi:uncharacterized membrane protein YesL